MDWGKLADSAKRFLSSEVTAQTTGDRRTREGAEREAYDARHDVGQAIVDEATYRTLEGVLPQPLADMVTASRPEVRAAAADARRRADLAGQPVAQLRIEITGEDPGSGTFMVPCELRWPEDGDTELSIVLEAPDPLPVGRRGVRQVCVQVPEYRGPGRYDLGAYLRRPDVEWEPLEFCVCRGDDSGESDLYWYPTEVGVVDVTEHGLSYDLPVASAGGEGRVRCAIDWSPVSQPSPETADAAGQ